MAQELKVGPYVIRPNVVTVSDGKAAPGTTKTMWNVVAPDGQCVVSSDDWQDAISAAARLIANATPVEVKLVDGDWTIVAASEVALFRGIDAYGDQVYASAENSSDLYAVTPCCGASATGTTDGTACRSCYQLVDDYYGGPATVTIPVLTSGV